MAQGMHFPISKSYKTHSESCTEGKFECSGIFPVLLYGLECCHLNKADLQSLDFTSNRLFMKLFRTGSIDVVQECRSYFGVELPSCIMKKKQDKFLFRYNCVENLFCRYCSKL